MSTPNGDQERAYPSGKTVRVNRIDFMIASGSNNFSNSTHKIIAERRTAKMLAPLDAPLAVGKLPRTTLQRWVEIAGNAPFHKPSHPDHDAGSEVRAREPWRAVMLDGQDCRDTLQAMVQEEVDAGPLMQMLAAADGAVLVTALPNPPESDLPEKQDFEASFDNMEHIAAASAFCQSLLIAGEADGWRSYWSSGGQLRKNWGFIRFGIPRAEVFLGALFFFPPGEVPEGVETKQGALADKRSPVTAWARWADKS
jgi:hypothetical protein